MEPGNADPYEADTDCCCCVCCDSCKCKELRRESKNEKFCCCCPLKIGVYVIEGATIYFAVFLTISRLLMAFNAYIDGYFILVSIIIFIPLYFAFALVWRYGGSPVKSDREKVRLAVLLTAITLLLDTVWQVYYYSKKYQYKEVYSGMGDAEDTDNYQKTPKSAHVAGIVFMGFV